MRENTLAIDLDDQAGFWKRLVEMFPPYPVPDKSTITDAVALYEEDLEDFFDAPWTHVAKETRPPADELYLLSPTGYAYYLPAVLWWLSTEPQPNLLHWFGETLVVQATSILAQQLLNPSQLAFLISTLKALALKYTPDGLYPLEPGEDPAVMDPAFHLRVVAERIGTTESAEDKK